VVVLYARGVGNYDCFHTGATIGPFLVGALMAIGFGIPAIFMVFVAVLLLGVGVLLFRLPNQETDD
ncbi:MAG: hypothetical protein ACTICC_01585, partial [Lactiplantibacillus plantarum]